MIKYVYILNTDGKKNSSELIKKKKKDKAIVWQKEEIGRLTKIWHRRFNKFVSKGKENLIKIERFWRIY